jgi:hypothetical protein
MAGRYGAGPYRPDASTPEGYAHALRNVRAAKQFLLTNPEDGVKRRVPPLSAWQGAINHLEQNPGDLSYFEGDMSPRMGKHAK